jgi:hypothetical protein
MFDPTFGCSGGPMDNLGAPSSSIAKRIPARVGPIGPACRLSPVRVLERTAALLLLGRISARSQSRPRDPVSRDTVAATQKAQYPTEKEHIANREQMVYIAPILAMRSTSGAARRIRCEPVESRP